MRVVDVGPRPRTYLIVLDVQVRVGAVGHCLPARSLRVFQEGNDTISLVMVSCLLNDRSSRRHGVIDEETRRRCWGSIGTGRRRGGRITK